VSRPSPPSPSAPPAADERLTTEQAFSQLVNRVTPRALRWFARLCAGPAADREDVLQDALLKAYQKRESYDPARSRWEQWFYGFFVGEVLNYQKRRRRRIKRVDVAPGDLPDIAVDSPSPEEETEQTMRRRLLEKCIGNLDRRTVAIIFAKDLDGFDMEAIAAAHEVSVPRAYALYRDGKERLRRALEREQEGKRALGVAVAPITLDQLLASEDEPVDVPEDAMWRIWKSLDRVMAADKAAGRLGDDGTEVQRYMGVPRTAPRAGSLVRALRALLDPRVSHALTAVASAVGGAFITYQIMNGPADRPHALTDEARTREAAAATVALLLGPAPIDVPASERSAPAREAPELRADAGVPAVRASSGAPALRVDGDALELRPDAGPVASAAARDDIAAEQLLYEQGSTLYQEGKFSDAIEAFQKHSSEHPGGRFAAARDRLWTLALIRAGRAAEARGRIERLRQTNPGSSALKEFEQALNPHDRR
jgi:RNA polymerase sigma factor (sigma-70 family)